MRLIITILNVFLLFGAITVFASCKEQHQKAIDGKMGPDKSAVVGDTVSEIGKNIRCIFQDSKSNYWYGSDGEGAYRYDGTSVVRFTDKDGLCHNQVLTIQEDESGDIWFDTGGGVSRFDGRAFTTVASKENVRLGSGAYVDWKMEPDDLWFHAGGGGVYRYDGNALNYLKLPRTDLDAEYYSQYPGGLNPYGVYTIFNDSKGNLWLGTEYLGVCRYDGKSFAWFAEKGLRNSAVRAIFEDERGNLWFGNSDFGLFRYDGKSLTNLTEEKGIGDPGFAKRAKGETRVITGAPGKVDAPVSVMAINEDANGEIWVGTFNAGVWRYDGKGITGYTVEDGLASNAIMAIYKDRKGGLRFGVQGGGVYEFNGKIFAKSGVE